jgi:uncharacterized protein YecA (UPF0149 family)
MTVRQGIPKNLHQGLTTLCAKINPRAAPFYVPIRALPGGGATDCFLNVPKQIAAHGGSIVHGWRITELPGLFIEGEFHGIWLSPAGDYIDVTPSQGAESQTLFLRDADKNFDEITFTRRDNVRHPLKDHPTIHAYLAQCEAIYRYQETHTDPCNPRLFAIDESDYERLLQRKSELARQLALLPIGRNDPCRCGSGLKYKKCCGK